MTLNDYKYLILERIAICMVDGKLSLEQAKTIAHKQMLEDGSTLALRAYRELITEKGIHG